LSPDDIPSFIEQCDAEVGESLVNIVAGAVPDGQAFDGNVASQINFPPWIV
jgi:hypothetical protein